MNPHQELVTLEGICQRIDVGDANTVVRDALALSEQAVIPDEVRSLAINAMLIAQHDYVGEFASKEELLAAVGAL